MMNWYVYMLVTEKQNFYTGITTDLARRLQEHLDVYEGRAGAKGAKYFRTQKPQQIVYSHGFTNRADASKHEWEIKQLSRAEKLALITNAVVVGDIGNVRRE